MTRSSTYQIQAKLRDGDVVDAIINRLTVDEFESLNSLSSMDFLRAIVVSVNGEQMKAQPCIPGSPCAPGPCDPDNPCHPGIFVDVAQEVATAALPFYLGTTPSTRLLTDTDTSPPDSPGIPSDSTATLTAA